MTESVCPIIDAEGLTRRFGSFTAVDAISFRVMPGKILGFLGANGAGKTTAIRMLTGLLAPSKGRATVSGYDVATQAEAIKRTIGRTRPPSDHVSLPHRGHAPGGSLTVASSWSMRTFRPVA